MNFLPGHSFISPIQSLFLLPKLPVYHEFIIIHFKGNSIINSSYLHPFQLNFLSLRLMNLVNMDAVKEKLSVRKNIFQGVCAFVPKLRLYK